MQSIEKSLGITLNDVQQLVPAVKSAFTSAKAQYLKQTHPKLRLLDNLIMVCLATFVI